VWHDAYTIFHGFPSMLCLVIMYKLTSLRRALVGLG
jgi:hypothetical protein